MSDWERMADDYLRGQQQEQYGQQQERVRQKERLIARLREIVTALGIEQDLHDINTSTTYWGGRGTTSSNWNERGVWVRLAAAMPDRIERTFGSSTKTRLVPAHYEDIVVPNDNDSVSGWSGNSHRREWVKDQRVVSHRQLAVARLATRDVWLGISVAQSWSGDEYYVGVHSSNANRRDAYGRPAQPAPISAEELSIGTYPFERYDHEAVRTAMRERLLQCVIEQRQLESIPSAEARLSAELQRPENQPGAWYPV